MDVFFQELFKKAIDLVGSEFNGKLDYLYRCWLPARKTVEDAIGNRFEVRTILHTTLYSSADVSLGRRLVHILPVCPLLFLAFRGIKYSKFKIQSRTM